MTIQEALDRVDEMLPNMVSNETKIAWLADLDGQVWNDTIMTHEELPGDWPEEKPPEEEPVRLEPGVRHDFFDPLGKPGERLWPRGCRRTKHFKLYDATTPLDTQLLIRRPYADVYTYWLAAKVSERNMEIDKYNNFMTMYNNAMATWQDWWNRSHRSVYATWAMTF